MRSVVLFAIYEMIDAYESLVTHDNVSLAFKTVYHIRQWHPSRFTLPSVAN
jgi:hypothetical protein